MLRDPQHVFRKMWAATPFANRRDGVPACFERQRDRADASVPPESYFSDTLHGLSCDSNWYEGNNGDLGRQTPDFLAPAPALLGFDDTIDTFCAQHRMEAPRSKKQKLYWGHAGECVNANLNILSLYGDRVPYNLCRNLEWMTCAARGLLPGQAYGGERSRPGGSSTIRFAFAPGDLDPTGKAHPLGRCSGWRPPDARTGCSDGYATDDIFYLEVCIFNQICSNGEEIFGLEVGQPFHCDLSSQRFYELKRIVMEPP
ncbi:hypothetical protein AB1Y20_013989 [Prymnesium parvum]|uniref:Uncharacterized protein n=1 Tax=Prymnesium parvum TaxID=97485 RepID=A0AB34II16_PRYPA